MFCSVKSRSSRQVAVIVRWRWLLSASTNITAERGLALISFGAVKRPENLAMIQALGIEVRTVTPEELEEFDALALIDVQPPVKAIGVGGGHDRRRLRTGRSHPSPDINPALRVVDRDVDVEDRLAVVVQERGTVEMQPDRVHGGAVE